MTGKDRLAAALAAKGVAPDTSTSKRAQPATSTNKQRGARASGAKLDGPPPRRVLDPGELCVDRGPVFVLGDSRDVMRSQPAESVDLIFTDPGIGGSGVDWDHGVPDASYWDEMFRVAKPGAHLAIFSHRKYSHRVVTRAEDAGFEPRDTLLWIYPKGMPMALDIGQAVDKKTGGAGEPYFKTVTAMTDEQRAALGKENQWYGWGTELRPTWEPISILRKPCQGSVADNVLSWGTGAMNIDATRIESGERDAIATYIPEGQGDAHGLALVKHQQVVGKTSLGRWPADALFGHADECEDGSGCVPACAVASLEREFEGTAKFFYCPKADRREKDLGLGAKGNKAKGVKPVNVSRWVIDLLLPPGGLLLDPFMGTGSIGLGLIRLAGTPVGLDGPRAIRLAGRYVGVDSDPWCVDAAEKRFAAWMSG